MAINISDFNKIWASTSPLTPYDFSESNYKEGWNFIGGNPPARQMWDSIQKKNDEKSQWLYLNVVQGVPVGVVQAFAGSTTPEGWLLCDGSAVSRTDYADLYAVIGDTYGAGDESTTFNLPNLIDKFVEGSATSGTVKSAGLPNIMGSLSGATTLNVVIDGAFGWEQTDATNYSMNYQSGSMRYGKITFDASDSDSIYGNSATVQPPALTMRYIIKY